MKKMEGLESLNESIKQAPEKLKTTYEMRLRKRPPMLGKQ